jgi:outer membrane receptor protein involved in Fe transport
MNMSMNKKIPLLAAVLAAAVSSAAQETSSEADDILRLDEFVVTGVSKPTTTRMQTSVSVSSIPTEKLEASVPRSTAEIFRNIPGVRSEATSGDGNANITMRGMPMSTGGSQYVQLQEDGLPIFEFGDISFGTSDGFLRADYTVASVEAIRGGSASTFASNSPGGIINFISKTGLVEGGSLGVTYGLDYDSTRVDFDYGSSLSQDVRFHVGGFYRVGEGPRSAGYDANNGGQLKLNLTRQFENGYVRVYLKRLDDRIHTYMPMPTRVTGTAANPSIGSVAGYDVKTDTPNSAYFVSSLGVDGAGNPYMTDVRDGVSSRSSAVGVEASFDLDGGWTVSNRLRIASNDGRFVAPFPAEVLAAGQLAEAIGGAGATLEYANGPRAGEAITAPATLNGNGLLMRTHLFNTALNDFGMFANNLKVDKSFTLDDDSRVEVGFGLYKARQNIDMDWLWNTFLQEVKGDNPAMIDVRDAAGELVTDKGLVAYGVPAWGWFGRGFDTSYDIEAPFASVAYVTGKLNLDASVRRDRGEARGAYFGTVLTPMDVDRDGVIAGPETLGVTMIDRSNPLPVNYDWSYTSWSFGANYTVTKDLAAFARWSKGGRARADRLLGSPDILADGSLTVDGVAVNTARQIEAGVKYRTSDWIPGNLALFATLFTSETKESNSEVAVGGAELIQRVYDATGVELEFAYQNGGFELRGGVTWTDAEIADANVAALIGNTPRRQADFIYQLTPSFRSGRFEIGASVIGTTDSYTQDDNDLVMPGYVYVNPYASVQVARGLSLSLAVNNVFDTFGLSESEEGSIPANGVIRARGITGRTASLTLRYSF